VALIIGSIELIGVLGDQANITNGPIADIAENSAGLRRLRNRGAVLPVLDGRSGHLALRPHRAEVVSPPRRAERRRGLS